MLIESPKFERSLESHITIYVISLLLGMPTPDAIVIDDVMLFVFQGFRFGDVGLPIGSIVVPFSDYLKGS